MDTNTVQKAADFHFEIVPLEEPEMGETHLVIMTAWDLHPEDDQWPAATYVKGDELERFTTDNPYGAVEAAREAQAYTLEERLGPFGLYWEREMEERALYA